MKDRLTVNSENYDGRYTLKCLCHLSSNGVTDLEDDCRDYCELNADCEYCGIRMAFDRLAAYEDTGLSPKEIAALVADNKRLSEILGSIKEILKGK